MVGTDVLRLIEEAKAGVESHPCLWLRGLIPSSAYPHRPPPDYSEVRCAATPGLTELLARTRKGFSDGSGGEDNIVSRYREVYSGAATADYDPLTGRTRVEGLVAEVPGRQTVPRAELWAAALLLERAPVEGPFELTLDAAYVVKGLDRRAGALRGMNGDLWSILVSLADRRSGPTDISKVRSHVLDRDREALAAGLHHKPHVLGNELADAAAAAGAALFGDNGAAEASRKARWEEDRAHTIAVRLARIQARIWAKRAGAAIYEAPELPQVDEQLEELPNALKAVVEGVRSNGHHLTRHSRGLQCTRCGIIRGARRKEYWANTKCRPRLDAVSTVKRLRITRDLAADHPPHSISPATLPPCALHSLQSHPHRRTRCRPFHTRSRRRRAGTRAPDHEGSLELLG